MENASAVRALIGQKIEKRKKEMHRSEGEKKVAPQSAKENAEEYVEKRTSQRRRQLLAGKKGTGGQKS